MRALKYIPPLLTALAALITAIAGVVAVLR